MKNLQLALRTLVKTPSITAIAVISLGLGIGATTSIFSIFNQMLLRPLPVEEPNRLVNLSAPGPKPGSQSCNNAGGCDAVFSYAMFRDLEKAQDVFTGIAAHRSFGANLAYRGQTMSGEGMLVSGSYFSVLGLQPAVGRLLGPADDRIVGEPPIVVLSHAYWRARFEGSPAVLNETLIVNGQALTIVGVTPSGFDGTTLGSIPQVYVPITLRGAMQPGFTGFDQRRNYWAYLFARLKPDVTIERATAAINVLYRAFINDVEVPLQQGMSEQNMARFKTKQVLIEDGWRGQSSMHREAKMPIIILLAITTLVLLIACANIANLLLARAAARTGEMAVRLSIGARRRNLLAQLLTESCVLAVFGGIAGIAVARWTVDLIASLLPSNASMTLTFGLEFPVMLFAAAVTLGTGIVFGLFPALHSTRPGVLSALKGQMGQGSGGRSAARFRWILATVQIAMSMILLVSAGLFTKSLYNISRVDLGLRIDNMITFGLSPNLSGYSLPQSRTLFGRIEKELGAQPGVTSVTASLVPLLAGSNWGNDVSVQGFTAGPDVDSNSRYNAVGPGYFKTMGIPLITGREFTESDIDGAPKVAIVNEQFAKKFNLGRDAVGKRMKQGGGGQKDLNIEIVGLVQNAKYSDVKQQAPALFYLPYRQEGPGYASFYVRGSIANERLLSVVQPTVARIDPNLPVEHLRTMEQTVMDNIAPDRIITILSASFAILATLLASIGLYGVLAYTVAQRTREFGVCMALGAAPGRVRWMVLRQVGLMTIIGGTAGLVGALGLGRLVQSLLFEIKGYDPLVLVASTMLLALVAIAAGFAPAHRASKIDPMRALRYE
jgi:predicted permease